MATNASNTGAPTCATLALQIDALSNLSTLLSSIPGMTGTLATHLEQSEQTGTNAINAAFAIGYLVEAAQERLDASVRVLSRIHAGEA